MEKNKTYSRVVFTEQILRDAMRMFDDLVKPDRQKICLSTLSVSLGDDEWHFDSMEEFFADYRKLANRKLGCDRANISALSKQHGDYRFWYDVSYHNSTIRIGLPTREKIEKVFSIFENGIESCRISPPPPPAPAPPLPPPKIFIGHGQNSAWRDLKDHLVDMHQLQVECYESGARAGHAIRDTLEKLLRNNSFAILVMTGDDTTEGGVLRARQNVVHEAGLFQGVLGFERAVVLLENGVEGFSNLQGIEQIRFDRGNIRSTFGDVLAVIKREFPETG